MNTNNNLNTNLIKNDYIGIQQINIPGHSASGGMDYPEALPAGQGDPFSVPEGAKIENPQRPTFVNKSSNNISQGMNHIRGTEINQLNISYVQNSSKIMALDVQLKAIEKQLESYKWAKNNDYYLIMERKIKLQKEYQILNQEQNLIKQEIEYQEQIKIQKEIQNQNKKKIENSKNSKNQGNNKNYNYQKNQNFNKNLNNYQKNGNKNIANNNSRMMQPVIINTTNVVNNGRKGRNRRYNDDYYRREAEAECAAALCICCLQVAIEAAK